MAEPDGPVDEFDDFRAGGGLAVGVEHAVDTEVAVVDILPVVAAVGVGAVRVEDRMVHHLPDAAADQVVVAVDLLPVGLRVAGTDAHGVRVFAHEVRAVVHRGLFALVLADVAQLFDRRVHVGADIVGDALAVYRALIVDRQGGLRLQPGVHGVRVVVATGLVAEGPHDDRRVRADLVPLVEALDAFHVPGQPCRVMRDGVVVAGCLQLHDGRAVGLEVVLVDDVDAEFVGELEEQRIGRVVGRAHRVDVVLLAQEEVALDLVRGHRVSVRAGRVVLNLILFPLTRKRSFRISTVLKPMRSLTQAVFVS